jgi:hypothetical protein
VALQAQAQPGGRQEAAGAPAITREPRSGLQQLDAICGHPDILNLVAWGMAALEPDGHGTGLQPGSRQHLDAGGADRLGREAREGGGLAPVGTDHPPAHGQEIGGHAAEVPAVVQAHARAGGEDGIPDAQGRGQVPQRGAEAPEPRRLEGAEAQLHAPAASQVGREDLEAGHGIHGRGIDAGAAQSVLEGFRQAHGHGLAAQLGQSHGVPEQARPPGWIHPAQTEGERGGAGAGDIHGNSQDAIGCGSAKAGYARLSAGAPESIRPCDQSPRSR